MSVRILLVDDHTIMRQGLRLLLQTDPELEVVGEAADGEEAVGLAHQLKPQVVLMDLAMPGMNGIEATRIIHRELPDIMVLALTGVLEGPEIIEVLRAGAIGYLRKDKQATEVCQAIKNVVAGKVELPAEIVAKLLQQFQQTVPETTPKADKGLTQREIEVLNLLAQGYSNKQLALNLGIVEGTVKTYISSILAKLGVDSRVRAIIEARRLGLIDEEGD